jgi:hypothetical protein
MRTAIARKVENELTGEQASREPFTEKSALALDTIPLTVEMRTFVTVVSPG